MQFQGLQARSGTEITPDPATGKKGMRRCGARVSGLVRRTKARSGSLRPDVRGLGDALPALDLGRDELRELVRLHWCRLGTFLDEEGLHLARLDVLVDLGIELVDHRLRRARRCQHTPPEVERAALVAGLLERYELRRDRRTRSGRHRQRARLA